MKPSIVGLRDARRLTWRPRPRRAASRRRAARDPTSRAAMHAAMPAQPVHAGPHQQLVGRQRKQLDAQPRAARPGVQPIWPHAGRRAIATARAPACTRSEPWRVVAGGRVRRAASPPDCGQHTRKVRHASVEHRARAVIGERHLLSSWPSDHSRQSISYGGHGAAALGQQRRKLLDGLHARRPNLDLARVAVGDSSPLRSAASSSVE